MHYKKTILTAISVVIPLVVLSHFFIDKPVRLWVDLHRDEAFFAWADFWSEAATTTYILIFLALLWLYFKYLQKNLYRQTQTAFLFSSIVVTGIAAQVLKFVFAKPRPRMFKSDGLFEFEFFMRDSNFSSFPSGHATTAFTIFIVLVLLFPRYWVLFLVYALSIITARVASHAHYVSDVMAGGLLGTIVTLLIYEKYFYKALKHAKV